MAVKAESKQIMTIHGKGGFTLLEVLIAMFVATVGLLALAMMQGNSIQGNSYGSQLTLATNLAQDKLEELNSAELDTSESVSTPLKPGITDADTLETIDDYRELGGTVFNRSWNVAANTTFSRIVTVTVSWTNDQIKGPDGNHRVVLSKITRGDQN